MSRRGTPLPDTALTRSPTEDPATLYAGLLSSRPDDPMGRAGTSGEGAGLGEAGAGGAAFRSLMKQAGLTQKLLGLLLGRSENCGRWCRTTATAQPAPRYAVLFVLAWIMLDPEERWRLIRLARQLQAREIQGMREKVRAGEKPARQIGRTGAPAISP